MESFLRSKWAKKTLSQLSRLLWGWNFTGTYFPAEWMGQITKKKKKIIIKKNNNNINKKKKIRSDFHVLQWLVLWAAGANPTHKKVYLCMNIRYLEMYG